MLQERIGVWLGLRDRGAASLVINVEPEVEAAQQLEEPLMHQCLGHHDQHPARAAGQNQTVQDEACLDRLAQSDLVG